MTLSNCAVSHARTVVTRTATGDETRATTTSAWEWALIAPRSSSERVDPRTPAVIDAATLYGPHGLTIGHDDTFTVSGHSPAMDGLWHVDGHAGSWSLGDWRPGLEVAVKRAG